MKHNVKSRWAQFRKGIATAIACIVVLGVPALTVLQFWHPHSDHRKATPIAAMQTRSIDNTPTTPKLFQQPLISVTFDDGYETTYQDSLPILQKHGIHSTQYILSGVENNPLYLNWAQVKAIQKAGHEIGCHTVTHPDLTTVSQQELMHQLTDCKKTMEHELGTSVTDFASPYGAENAQTLADIKKVFASQRNVYGDSSNGVTNVDVNTAKKFKPNDIIGMTVKHDTSLAEIQALVDFTIKNNGWLVLTYHQADDGASKYALDTSKLDDQMNLLEHTQVRIVTVHQALSGWKSGN
jgi:peptidoglycan/xylan/chitin deacetylase (PgdA/CDA1 family)